MSYYPMILDGPLRGQEHKVEHMGQFFYDEPIIGAVLEYFMGMTDPSEPVLRVKRHTYFIHKVKLGRYCVLVASENPAQPDLYDLMDLMLTDYAKKAIVE